MNTYFFKHLKDLQLQIILYICLYISFFIISYIYSDQWIYILIKPLIYIKKSNYLIFTDIIEIFLIKMILSLFISFILSLLCFFFQLWFFLSPGLFKRENILIFKILIIFSILLIISFYYIFMYIIPNAWKFFIEFENTKHPFLYKIYLEPKLYDYILFIIKILFITTISFQYPFLIFILLIYKIINIKHIIKFRKIFYLKILLIASLITPPDIWSQIIIFVLLVILIEMFLLFYFIIEKN